MFHCTGRKLQCHFKDMQLYPRVIVRYKLWGLVLNLYVIWREYSLAAILETWSVFTFLFYFFPHFKNNNRKAVVKGGSLKNGLVDIS